MPSETMSSCVSNHSSASVAVGGHEVESMRGSGIISRQFCEKRLPVLVWVGEAVQKRAILIGSGGLVI